MSSFLTVKDAARRTGKSPSSIRRIIYPIVQNDGHPDRRHIEPSVEDARKLRVKGENFAWRLSEELLRREVPEEGGAEKGSSVTPPKNTADGNGELIAMLRGELEIKNRQITQQGELIAKHMEVITGLGERIRESNILIGSFQQRLALQDGRESTTPEAVKSKRQSAPPPEKGSSTPPKPAKPKRGFFSRLFR